MTALNNLIFQIKKSIWVLLLTGLAIPGFAHNLKMATYSIGYGESGLELWVAFDQHDLKRALEKDGICNGSGALSFCLDQYISHNLSATINGQKMQLEFSSSNKNEEYITVVFSIKNPPPKIMEFKLNNTCMIELDDDYRNIVMIDLQNDERSYRMTKDRTEIIVKY